MRRVIARVWAEEAGGQLTEYALVLGLIAIAAVAALTATGQNLASWWDQIAQYIGQTLPQP